MLKVFCGSVLIFAMAMIAAMPLYFFGMYQCHTFENITGKETKYAGLMCYINVNGDFMPYEEYKMRSITNEER